ncbi:MULTISPECIES: ABC transporter permease subunit [Pseudomonadota]|uniref:amino acid ABC transporter permease n=1 Tax=Pseudomonadota TaxID=1224 RepID=UPI0020197070|nr:MULTISPECIES: ABC transporter permease subunit [Pseudomonadota]MCL4068116.1 ABC transporter permease subunit [Pseudomonas sp. GX19020]MDF3907326.1 ABC transporter permease subunit [Paracoccus sp. AS002]
MTNFRNLPRWLHVNLFAKPFDTVLTLIVVPLLCWAVASLLHWVIVVADWSVVIGSLKVLMTGLFPAEKMWLVWIAASLIAGLIGLASSVTMPFGRAAAFCGMLAVAATLVAAAWTPSVAPQAALVIATVFCVWAIGHRSETLRDNLTGIAFGVLITVLLVLSPAGPSTWGGLLLSVVLTLTAALLTIPLGVFLAFGRQSKVASLSALCTGYIEVMRSVPLILVVYCIWIAFPLALPQFPVPDVVRGLIGFTLFYSAYAAEFIRTGLQAVARGQTEAAQSLGLSDTDIKRIVILPQALRVAVPGLVGNILDIFNYAPLVFIIGLTDFLRAGQMILANPENSGRTYEIYVFLFFVYFVVGSVITFQARRLEQKLSKGARK